MNHSELRLALKLVREKIHYVSTYCNPDWHKKDMPKLKSLRRKLNTEVNRSLVRRATSMKRRLT